ncbi:MAG TPA: ImmA/IrrE family metallo-endopeptidase [Anaerolineales bacterium]|nr:ImmA/IrrE family metallo-endopeptidase [Anaerolineales bacterium]
MFAGLDASFYELEEQYYLMLRSSIVPTLGCINSFVESGVLRELRKISAELVVRHTLNGKAERPFWIDQEIPKIIEKVRKHCGFVNDIEVLISVEGRIHARAISNRKIVLACGFREFLRHCNLVLWTLLDLMQPSQLHDGFTSFILENTGDLARGILPYFLAAFDLIPVANIPFVATSRVGILFTANQTARIQATYLLAHEYAHIALGHFNIDRRKLDREEKERLEIEADRFALNIVVELANDSEIDKPGDVWLALRWLHEYRIIEEVIAKVSAGAFDSLDSLASTRRKNALNEMRNLTYFDSCDKADLAYASFGLVLLFALKSTIVSGGDKLISNILEQIAKVHDGPASSTWWKSMQIVLPDLYLAF